MVLHVFVGEYVVARIYKNPGQKPGFFYWTIFDWMIWRFIDLGIEEMGIFEK